MNRPVRRAAVAALALLLVACASNPRDVIFVTKTSFGLDVSAQPPGASIGYDRVEGYLGPRPDDGRVPPVAASFVTNGKLLDRQIRQVYATGRAAEIVTRPAAASAPAAGSRASASSPSAPPSSAQSSSTAASQSPVMFFSTGSTLGLKLGFGSAGVTDWVTVGYKRRELSLIPLTDSEFPSVLASIDNDIDVASRASAAFGVGQYFATGSAAQTLAADADVQSLFRHRMRGALGATEREEKSQAETALLTLNCLAQLPDSDLPRVFRHAKAVKLFDADAPNLLDQLQALPSAQARSSYTRYLAASDGASPARGQALSAHRAAVCAFAVQ